MRDIDLYCPYCFSPDLLIKAGRNPSGTQIYKCKICKRKHTPTPKIKGYSKMVRGRAIRLYEAGLSYRAVAQRLSINHQTVANWINEHLDLV